MPAPDRLNTKFSKFFEIGWTVVESGCWEWNGWRDTLKRGRGGGLGHGGVYYKRKRHQVHRLSHEWFNGPIPEGLLVRHRCDNPPCVNPGHLEVGTPADNTRDMWERGRSHAQRMTHFRCGHAASGDNVRLNRRRGVVTSRTCRTCDNARKLADYHRKSS